MRHSLDSLLIIAVAICTVSATAVTIHDANEGKPMLAWMNQVNQQIESVVHWLNVRVKSVESGKATSLTKF